MDYSVSLAPEGLPTREKTRNGDIYQIGDWYPRVAVYDDIDGWAGASRQAPADVFSEYGSYEYRVTVPASMIVAGSGTLMNPGDVLIAEQQRRLSQARTQDGKVAIISPNEAGTPETRPQQNGLLTWHFQMNGTRDVAWAASSTFVWNATQIPRPDRRSALAMSFYPQSSVGGNSWNRSTPHTKRSVNFYSKQLYPYPWNTAINVAGPVGDRAFPGISFCDRSASGYALFACTARHQAQNWFPGIVGTDERRHPWMDEGLATFMSARAHQQLYDGEFAPKRDYAGTEGNQTETLLSAVTTLSAPPVMVAPGLVDAEQQSVLYSSKPALGLDLLRTVVLGPERFDYALRRYVQRWAFRRATPFDFFRTMNDVLGRDLSWFWKGWFGKTWALDQAIKSVAYVDDQPEKGALVTTELRRQLPMPVEVKIQESDGDRHRLRWPVTIWQEGATHTFRVPSDTSLSAVQLDPNETLPDVNRSNDGWSPQKLGNR